LVEAIATATATTTSTATTSTATAAVVGVEPLWHSYAYPWQQHLKSPECPGNYVTMPSPRSATLTFVSPFHFPLGNLSRICCQDIAMPNDTRHTATVASPFISFLLAQPFVV